MDTGDTGRVAYATIMGFSSALCLCVAFGCGHGPGTAAPAPVAAEPESGRVLLARSPGEWAYPERTQYFVPVACHGQRSGHAANPTCAAMLRTGSEVVFPDGLRATIDRIARGPCEFEPNGDPWNPDERPNQPSAVLVWASPEAAPQTPVALWPDGDINLLIKDNSEVDIYTDPDDSFPKLSAAARAGLHQALGGEVQGDPLIYQHFEIDLDADGLPERVFTTRFSAPEPDPENPTGPVTSFCVAQGTSPDAPQCFDGGAIQDRFILGTLDLDGDGQLELLLQVVGNGFIEYAAWRRSATGWKKLGPSHCGG